jgi:aspartate-semialdehyde dehydrogenase
MGPEKKAEWGCPLRRNVNPKALQVEMTSKVYRIGIVGASSLAGKELNDELGESPLAASRIVLLEDEDESIGKLTTSGDEISLIQKLDRSAFEGMDFVFFAGQGDETLKYWQDAQKAGAAIVDMTYVLEGEKDVLVASPWISEASGRQSAPGGEFDLGTQTVVPAHPVVVMLGLVAARVQRKLPLHAIAATVMEPASEHGSAAMDELHQQTVSLLSFQDLPRDQYDAQVSFNLLASLGDDARVKLSATEERIQRQYRGLLNGALPQLSLQMVQAPVFHGYVASVYLETVEPVTISQLEDALAGEHLDLMAEGSESPSNLSAAGQEEIMLRVRKGFEGEEAGTRFWLWMAADNLKLAAIHAIACAGELGRLRPSGKVQ